MRGKIIGTSVNPMDQEYKITIVLPLSDWEKVCVQMDKMDGNESYPAWHIVEAIKDCIRNAKSTYSQEIEIK